jgi:multidrug efflux pump subunit AcrB
MAEDSAVTTDRGPIAWMVRNRVTPNLLMLVLLFGGLFATRSIKQEVFPEFDLDRVIVEVAYPGASPAEVEQGIVLSVEEAVRGLEGVKEIVATASEGRGLVSIELIQGSDHQKTFEDIRQQIDRVRTFPEDAEEPEMRLEGHRHEVLTMQIYGDASELVLRALAEQVRDRLLQHSGITQVDLIGVRDAEVQVEMSRDMLRAYSLTLGEVARRIAATSLDLPGGSLETAGGDVLLRMTERRDRAEEFAEIALVTTASGSVVRLGDVAAVREGFEDVDRFATYDGKPALGIGVFRVGNETPIGVSRSVHEVMGTIERELPPGIEIVIQRDSSEIYSQRLELLLRNALLGLALVLALLSIFLEFRLAFWVTMGIPTAFLGGLLLLPWLGTSINMITMFAFVIALGIVVDDAIVAGENIYEYRQRGMDFVEAAIQGARAITVPVSFSILTNIVAFLPLMFIPGFMGKIWGVIPIVVTTVFVISWGEALFILPSHLAHTKAGGGRGWGRALHDRQQAFSAAFSRFVEYRYGAFLDLALRNRYITVAIAVGLLLVVLAWAGSGRLGLILMPTVESDRAVVTAALPVGSPVTTITEVRDHLVEAGRRVAAAHGADQLVSGIFAIVNANTVEVNLYLTDPDVRPISTSMVTRFWRDEVGLLPGLESLRFEADRGGPGRGPGVTVELSHRTLDVLEQASARLAADLSAFGNVHDVDDGYTPGKAQLDFFVTPIGRSLGLTSERIARQVRDAFNGAEALRQQRGRSEVTVRVRLPEEERMSEHDLSRLTIRTPAGTDVPLFDVARFERGRAYRSLTRRNGRNTVTASGNVIPRRESNQVLTTLREEVLPALVRDFPGLSWSFEGRQAMFRESVQSLFAGLGVALVIIYVLLAIPFRSYSQPAIVMSAIPFGAFGAVIGHALMGYSLSVISFMGIVALSGVVVNDALVMIDYANARRRGGEGAREAIRSSGIRRFRPILLTTLTTFGGLAPMIFETSRQARFMIPMAISLGYGIVFATAITLLIVPCLYMILEDLLGCFRRRTEAFE